jgi:ParB/RepB/Spo0J family partition protein
LGNYAQRFSLGVFAFSERSKAMQSKIDYVPLDKITPSVFNNRKDFDTGHNSLVESIRQQGILQPIVVRPSNGFFEIVAGERRYWACKELKLDDIPAIIRNLDDDQAFEVMTVENLQRQDLTEYEEAMSFKDFLDRKGEDAIPDLAQKIGISPAYIRKRAHIMALPKYMLQSWEKGEIKTGHLYELLRISDKSERKEMYEDIIRYDYSVARVRHQIAVQNPSLTLAIFDKSDCESCNYNSETQRQLFDVGEKSRSVCMNHKCFQTKVVEALESCWEDTEYFKEDKCGGYRFTHELDSSAYTDFFHPLPVTECSHCDRRIALISLAKGGHYEPHRERCIDKVCATSMERREKARDLQSQKFTEIDGSDNPDKPRVSWHGDHFREKFFKERLPNAIQEVKPNSETAARLALFTVLRKFPDLHPWFADKTGYADQEDIEEYYYRITPKNLFAILTDYKTSDLREMLVEAMSKVIITGDFSLEDREFVADHVGIDLSKEWKPDDEFFQKKIKKELLHIGHTFGVFKQPRAQQLLHDIYRKGYGGFESLKKSEIVAIFQDEQIDLTGVVPSEILQGTIWANLTEKGASDEQS